MTSAATHQHQTSHPPCARTAPLWHQNRDSLAQLLERNPDPEVPEEEVAAHFEGMPSHYWERVTESELRWGLQTVHRFLHGLAASDRGGTPAVVTWRDFPRIGCTKLLVSTWDRAGLLANIAGYASALRLNIVRAEVFTREDNIVLDVFWLCNPEGGHIDQGERLRQLGFLIEGGISEPPRFVSNWACTSHKLLPRAPGRATTVGFDQTSSPDQTIITIESTERLGLLHDILLALGAHRINITEALIDTIGGVARDIFYVTDEQKRKLSDPELLRAVERSVIESVDG